MGRRAASTLVVAAVLAVVGGCGVPEAQVETVSARPITSAGEPPATIGRLQPVPDLSLPVEPVSGEPAADSVADSVAVPGSGANGLPTTVARSLETPLTFGWAVPCAVPVVEAQEFGDSTSTVGYTVHLEADPETSALVMRQTDVRVIDINGLTPSPAEAEAVAAGTRIPEVLVGFDGVETGARGTAELFDELVAVGVFGDAPVSDVNREQAISQLETTATIKYWNSWVGLWAQIGRVPTEPLDIDNVTLDVVTEAVDRVELRLTEDLTGAALADVLGVTVETGGDPTIYEKVRRLKVIETVTDPATLRPETAKFSFDVSGEIDNEPQSIHEVHAVTFMWAAAQGCGVN